MLQLGRFLRSAIIRLTTAGKMKCEPISSQFMFVNHQCEMTSPTNVSLMCPNTTD